MDVGRTAWVDVIIITSHPYLLSHLKTLEKPILQMQVKEKSVEFAQGIVYITPPI